MIDWFQFLAWKMKLIQGMSLILMLDRYKARDGEISTSSKICVTWQVSQNAIFLFESFCTEDGSNLFYLKHGGSWVRIPSGAQIFSVSSYCRLFTSP